MRLLTTHELSFAGTRVTKRFRQWQGGEHRREWTVLRHLHHHAPGLGPEPISADLDAVPPVVVMTRLPGEPVSPVQVDHLARAIGELWTVPWDDPEIDPWRDDLHFAHRLIEHGVPTGVRDAVSRWWDGPDPALLRTEPEVKVLGHRDAYLANYLWDGTRVRIIDFEDARTSDPATELAILLEHLSARAIDAERLLARFEVDRQRLLAARRLWAMFWLWLLRPGSRSARHNPPGTAEAQAERVLELLGTR